MSSLDMSTGEMFQSALRLHQAGRLQEAEALYGQLLATQPGHADALHLLGVVAYQTQRLEMASDLIRRALVVQPNTPAFYCNLGTVLGAMGRPGESAACFEKALTIQPTFAEAHFNLGNALKATGQADRAIESYRKALSLKPDYAKAHANLADALLETGQAAEAESCCRSALALRPDMIEGHITLGAALLSEGRAPEAVDACRRALTIQPNSAQVHTHLGCALVACGRVAESVACFQTAVSLDPRQALPLSNLGNALRELGRLDESIVASRRAVALAPEMAHAHSNLILTMNYQVGCTPSEILAETRRWVQQHASPLAAEERPHLNDRSPDRRLRVGYVSADLRQHPVAHFFEPLLASHDHAQVESFCYADLPRPDAVTARLAGRCDHWRNIAGQSDAQLASLVRDDRIDILVDLAGHTACHRLLAFARKPAPVQVTYLGYSNTTGLPGIEYRLTDAWADPIGAGDAFHTETLIRLPETFACFQPLHDSPPVALCPPACASGRVTFGSFHGLAKLNDFVLGLWARVLLQSPLKSRLLIVASAVAEASVRGRILSALAAHGVPADRIDFEVSRPMRDYLALHDRVDILLDCFPFTGHTTACHALWMGVPAITLAGDVHRGRMVGSVLRNVGVPELIAETPDQYVRLATELASDFSRLADLRARLRPRMQASPLLDGGRLTRHVEAFYRTVWTRWCASQ